GGVDFREVEAQLQETAPSVHPETGRCAGEATARRMAAEEPFQKAGPLLQRPAMVVAGDEKSAGHLRRWLEDQRDQDILRGKTRREFDTGEGAQRHDLVGVGTDEGPIDAAALAAEEGRLIRNLVARRPCWLTRCPEEQRSDEPEQQYSHCLLPCC